MNPYDPLVSKQISLFGEDDRTYAREQTRKRAPKAEPPMSLPDGPCCARCWNWLPPEMSSAFGTCTVSCVVTTVEKGAGYGIQRGACLLVAEAYIPGVEWEFFRTRGAYPGCSQFGAETPAGEQAA